MITGIVQLPNRLSLGTVLFGGELVDRNVSGIHTQVLSGRSIRVVPLFFYKFFSQWGKSFYEHIFATDEPFDTLTMTRFVDSTSGQYSKSNMGSVLVPISMKRISEQGIQNFLFAKSIDFLIRNYQIGTPLSSIPFSGVDHFDNEKCIEVATEGNYSRGVQTYGAYRKFLFQDVIYSTYGKVRLPNDVEFALEHMTTEEPALIVGCMSELMSNYSTPDAVWAYIDDLYKYETGDPIDPKDFFAEHNYHESIIDPLTLQCLRTPTYLLLSNLKPYISQQHVMRTSAIIGTNPQNDEFTSNIIPFQFGNKMNSYTKYGMIESLMWIADDWFTIRMNWDNYIPEFFSRQYVSSHAPLEILHSDCRQLFLNKSIDGEYAYDDIIISKNWFDEIFISCKNKKGITTYYINLAWFHLMSPSLINDSLFIR